MSKTKRTISIKKTGLSSYFQEFEKGDHVAIVKEPSVTSYFPLRLQGITGVIQGKRGKIYVLEIKDQSKKKKFLIEPIHLKLIRKASS